MNTNKQPSGFKILFFAELWERFGFYTIQALLVLYLSKVLLFSDSRAYGTYAAFSGLIYATPVIGGFIADRLLGFKRAIILGALLYIIGYFTLAIPGNPYFYPALAFLIWGNGFFKSCISSFLGSLYEKNDPRRDGGFTLFYMGINIGSFLAPIITTAVAVKFGWNYGFGVAGLGMTIGLITCLHYFPQFFVEKGLPPNSKLLARTQYFFYLCLIIVIGLTSLLLCSQHIINWGLIIFSILTIIFLVSISFKYPSKQRNKLWALIVLIVFSIIFWAFYWQTFMSVTLFIDRCINRQVLSWVIPTAMFQSINPFFIIFLSPLFATFWLRLNRSKYQISTAIKFAIGLLFMGIGFLCLVLGISLAGANGLVAAGWIVLFFLIQTFGELSLSPIGLSAVTELSPSNLTGMLMGVWFLAFSAAFAIGDKIADMTNIPKGMTDLNAIIPLYKTNFMYFGLCAVVFGLILIGMNRWLGRMMRG